MHSQSSGDSSNKSTVSHGKPAPVCKFFLKGHCSKDKSCRFQHPRKLSKRTESLPSASEKDKICPYYRRGYCRFKDTCKLSHVLPVLTDETSEPSLQQGNASTNVKTAADKPSSSARRNVFLLRDLEDSELAGLKAKDLRYLSQRFAKAETQDNIVTISFGSSDPDWPYDVKNVTLKLTYPASYPVERLSVQLDGNEALPALVERTISASIEEWLSERFDAYKTTGQVELVTRAFLHWLDGALEELFTQGLRTYQRELMANAAGLQFISASELRDQFANQRSSDGESGDDNDESHSDNSEWETDSEEEEALPANPNYGGDLEAKRRGIEIKLQNLQLKENVASLMPETLQLIVQCSRCPSRTEFNTYPMQMNVFQCGKCGQEQLLTLRANMAHQLSAIIGYVDVQQCSVFDVVLPLCSFKVGCFQCGRQMNFGGIMNGQIKDSWCHSCHAKISLTADCVRMTNLETVPSEGATGAVRVHAVKTKKQQDPAIKLGSPLPEEGVCRHYKKSYRWFRFPCCGKAYPCDICHDDNESHEYVRANRMICGFCCKEQMFAAERPCVACSSSLTKKSSAHWEGGKGCRDKIKMSRNDEAKYKNMNKTVSRKKQGQPAAVRSTKLRHN